MSSVLPSRSYVHSNYLLYACMVAQSCLVPGQRVAAQSPAPWASTSSCSTESTSPMSYLVTSASLRAFSHALIVHLVKCTCVGEMHSNLAFVFSCSSVQTQTCSPKRTAGSPLLGARPRAQFGFSADSCIVWVTLCTGWPRYVCASSFILVSPPRSTY